MASSLRSGPLLCGIDFSEHSQRALAWSAFLSRRLNVPITAATVLDPLLATAADTTLGPGRLTADTARDLERLIGELDDPARLASPATFVRVGDPAEELLAVASEVQASIVVVGTQGLGLAERLWFGSTTTRLLRRADRPVLAVPLPDNGADERAARPADSGVERVVCGVDFSPASEAASRAAVVLGAALGISVTLVHAIARFTTPRGFEDAAERAAAERLTASAAQLQQLAVGLTPVPQVEVVADDPADALIAASRSGGPALVVVGLAGGAVHRPGSVATRVLAGTRQPVLAVPE